MRVFRPLKQKFGLLAALAFVAGGLGAPFNLGGCPHHDAPVASEVAGGDMSSAHAAHDAGPRATDSGMPHPEGEPHGPCACIGDCAGASPVGISKAPSTEVAFAPLPRPGTDVPGAQAAPAAPTPYALPYPTAPPVAPTA